MQLSREKLVKLMVEFSKDFHGFDLYTNPTKGGVDRLASHIRWAYDEGNLFEDEAQ